MPGPRGPKPEPTAIKRLKGNPGRRRLPDEPPIDDVAAALAPDAPASPVTAPRTLTTAQREIWDQLVPDLVRLKLMRPTDRPAFTRYCAYLATWQDAERKLRGKPLVKVTKSKFVEMERMNRLLQIMITLDKVLRDLEDRFGMSPSARQRILTALANPAPVAANQSLPGLEADAPPPASRSAVGYLRAVN